MGDEENTVDDKVEVYTFTIKLVVSDPEIAKQSKSILFTRDEALEDCNDVLRHFIMSSVKPSQVCTPVMSIK